MTTERAAEPLSEPSESEDRSRWPEVLHARLANPEPEPQPPVRWRELLAVGLLVVLCDLTIYRGQGFAGYAALFFLSPLLLAWGAYRPRLGPSAWIAGAMLALLAAKSVWCGSALLVAAGFALLAAFAAGLSGQTPFVMETIVFVSLAVAAGYKRLNHYGRSTTASSRMQASALNIAMPLAALIAFGTVFILANPDLLASVSATSELIIKRVRQWLLQIDGGELVFWVASLWIATGLLRQASGGILAEQTAEEAQPAAPRAEVSKFYPAFRNTLLTVIVLFAAYLAFEFRTLWFRKFPAGFYYSGYAHEGAAWLTFALALATAVLSLVFRGGVLRDPRLRRLRALGWIWSAENFVLTVAVYHRMAIYVDFNGMTPMRIVGLYGISAVVAGFALVLWKIGRGRSFGWLVRRQLWALALVVYLFALTPVDAICVRYNVRRILAGDPAPSVQISVHPIGPEGVLLLEPLLGSDDAIIREGVRAMLAQRADQAETAAARRQALGWTAYQLADERVLKRLRADRSHWSAYQDHSQRAAALERFHKYAYQWY